MDPVNDQAVNNVPADDDGQVAPQAPVQGEETPVASTEEAPVAPVAGDAGEEVATEENQGEGQGGVNA